MGTQKDRKLEIQRLFKRKQELEEKSCEETSEEEVQEYLRILEQLRQYL